MTDGNEEACKYLALRISSQNGFKKDDAYLQRKHRLSLDQYEQLENGLQCKKRKKKAQDSDSDGDYAGREKSYGCSTVVIRCIYVHMFIKCLKIEGGSGLLFIIFHRKISKSFRKIRCFFTKF